MSLSVRPTYHSYPNNTGRNVKFPTYNLSGSLENCSNEKFPKDYLKEIRHFSCVKKGKYMKTWFEIKVILDFNAL